MMVGEGAKVKSMGNCFSLNLTNEHVVMFIKVPFI